MTTHPTPEAPSDGLIEQKWAKLVRAAKAAARDVGDDPDQVWVDCAKVQVFEEMVTPEIIIAAAARIQVLEGERDAARAAQRNLLERGMKLSGKCAMPVWLERSMGADFLWLVWAIKPGDCRLMAVCSDETTADRYMTLPPGLSEFKAWKERAPIDHGFGFADSMHARVQGKL